MTISTGQPTPGDTALDVLKDVAALIAGYLDAQDDQDEDTPTRDEATDAETRGPADEDEQRPRNLLSALRRAK